MVCIDLLTLVLFFGTLDYKALFVAQKVCDNYCWRLRRPPQDGSSFPLFPLCCYDYLFQMYFCFVCFIFVYFGFLSRYVFFSIIFIVHGFRFCHDFCLFHFFFPIFFCDFFFRDFPPDFFQFFCEPLLYISEYILQYDVRTFVRSYTASIYC